MALLEGLLYYVLLVMKQRPRYTEKIPLIKGFFYRKIKAFLLSPNAKIHAQNLMYCFSYLVIKMNPLVQGFIFAFTLNSMITVLNESRVDTVDSIFQNITS